MNDIIRLIDDDLKYENREIDRDTIYIYVSSSRTEFTCHYCANKSNKIHSKYTKTIQDLTLQDKKIVLVMEIKNFFCLNQAFSYKTFAEIFLFLNRSSKKTTRLIEEIVEVSLRQSSLSAVKYLQKNVVSVKKSIICNYLKNNKTS